MINVFCISLGCPKNRVDTERLLAAFGPDFQPVESQDQADVVLINTCAFIQPAVEESVQAIMAAVAGLDQATERPLLAVAGCLVSRYGRAELAKEIPEVDVWLSSSELMLWPDKLAQALAGRGQRLAGPATSERILSTGPSYAYLKIAEGCPHRCAFCLIPAIRGKKIQSERPDRLVRQAEDLLDQGVSELILVAQDLTGYGRDLGMKHGLPDILDRLLPLGGLKRLRLMYLYPTGLSDELLKYLSQAGSVFLPYFDLPFQHSHPDMLKLMRRPVRPNPRQMLERIRSFFPTAAIRTTLITGFPGESTAHFRDMRDFVEQAGFSHLGVFTWQAEEGSAAVSLPDWVSPATAKKRRGALMKIQADISARQLGQYVGQTLDILVDRPHDEWPGLHVGRAWFQAPEVDGVTYVSGPGVKPGALVKAVIEDSKTYDLVGLV